METETRDIDVVELTEQMVWQLTKNFGDLPTNKRWAIARDVFEAARQTYSSPNRPRPSTMLRELKKLQREMRKRTTVPEISDDLLPALGIGEEEIDAIRGYREVFVDILDASVRAYESTPETVMDRQGGRRRDPRINRFAYRLARIYVSHLNKRPTFTQDTEKGWVNSPFAMFGEEAFYLFCELRPMGPGQIKEALRSAVALERDYELCSPDFDPTPTRC